MLYSIGEVASLTGIAISTLRYYDREGFFPNLERSEGGIRKFCDRELEALAIIECLKTSGLSIHEIKLFLKWCQEGDSSLQQRRDLFYDRLAAVTQQMETLQKIMNTIRFKCWYYDTALAAGTEDAPKNLAPAEIPEDVLAYQRAGCLNTHK